MINRRNFDLSAYLVIGPENTKNRSVAMIIRDAVEVGFTCLQIRSKVASAEEMIALTKEAADVLQALEKENEVALLVDDRLDVVLAARKRGVKVDGIHVGQTDIPVDVCRHYLGAEAIVGLTARSEDVLAYVKEADTADIDYFGVGPLRETQTKLDCGLDASGNILTKNFREIAEIAEASPVPIVVGGGVKLADIPELAQTGADGFFVVSAVTEAKEPRQAARDLAEAWENAKLIQEK